MSRHSSLLQVCSLAHLWREMDTGSRLPVLAPQPPWVPAGHLGKAKL